VKEPEPNQFKSLLGVGEGFRSKPGRAVVLLRAGSRTERSPSIPATPAVRAAPPQPQPHNLRGICGCLISQVGVLVSLRDLVSVRFLLEVGHTGVGMEPGNRRFQKNFPPNGWWE